MQRCTSRLRRSLLQSSHVFLPESPPVAAKLLGGFSLLRVQSGADR